MLPGGDEAKKMQEGTMNLADIEVFVLLFDFLLTMLNEF